MSHRLKILPSEKNRGLELESLRKEEDIIRWIYIYKFIKMIEMNKESRI